MAERSTVRDWSLRDIVEGAAASFERRIEARDIDAFAQLSGDVSPLHVDAEYARAQGFHDRVAHGALLAGLASRLIGTELPGRRALLLNLRLDFPAPTFSGDVLEVAGTVSAVHASQQVIQVRIEIRCGVEVRARGSAMVRVREDGV